MSARLLLSAAEIAAGLRRAAIGRGWPQGLAEEAARAGALRVALRPGGLADALAAIEADPGPARAAIAEGTARFEAARALAAGPSAIDLMVAGDVREARLLGCDAPGLVLAMAALRAPGLRAALESAPPAAIDPSAALAPGDLTLLSARGGSAAAVIPPAEIPAAAIAVDPALWARVQTLAARTYVPATEHSRASGAGAGLRDPD